MLGNRALGNIIGGIAGYIGSDFEKYLLTSDTYNVIGPRLGAINIQTFCYGHEIPKIYGKVKLSGNIVWYGEVREEKKTKVRKFGKLFKHKEYNDSYLYYATFAIVLCEGVVDKISRIWADDEEVFLNSNNLKIYYGTDDQLPDPTIANYKGMHNTLAYRGLCYVVLKDFPIDPRRSTLPKFDFEIIRSTSINPVFSKILAINLGPGYRENCYDMEVVYKKFYSQFDYGLVYHEHVEAINLNASREKSDAKVTIDKIANELENLKWIAVSVCWYTNSINIAESIIYPTVEFKEWAYTEPNDWQVGNFTRKNAKVAGAKVSKGRTYRGTPSDASILGIIRDLNKRGYNVMFVPKIILDGQKHYANSNFNGDLHALESFYSNKNGYNQFIVHYARLLKDEVKAFIIGSELINLNKMLTRDKRVNIAQLRKLAAEVRSIFSERNIKVTYAAAVNEYENLYELWNDENIDFIAINNRDVKTEELEGVSRLLSERKQIWFTEFGSPSFKSSNYLTKSLEYWSVKEFIGQIFLYYYDIDPNIEMYGNNKDNLAIDFALNNRIGTVSVKDIICDLGFDFNKDDLIKFDLDDDYITGAVFVGIKSQLEFLSLLSMSMNYNFYETDGKIVISNRPNSNAIDIAKLKFDLVEMPIGNIFYNKISNIKVSYINQQKNCEPDYLDCLSGLVGEEVNIQLPFVMANNEARNIGSNIFNVLSNIQNQLKFVVPLQLINDYNFKRDIVFLERCYQLTTRTINDENQVRLVYSVKDNSKKSLTNK